MKNLLLIIFIICTVAGVLSVLFAALNLFAYHNMLDGSSELYAVLHRRAIVWFAVGAAVAVAGAACMIIRSNL